MDLFTEGVCLYLEVPQKPWARQTPRLLPSMPQAPLKGLHEYRRTVCIYFCQDERFSHSAFCPRQVRDGDARLPFRAFAPHQSSRESPCCSLLPGGGFTATRPRCHSTRGGGAGQEERPVTGAGRRHRSLRHAHISPPSSARGRANWQE